MSFCRRAWVSGQWQGWVSHGRRPWFPRRWQSFRSRGLQAEMSHERRPCRSRGLRAEMSHERRPGFHHGQRPWLRRERRPWMSHRWWHGTEDAGVAPEDQGMLGFGKGVRAVGAVCGGSRPGVSRGDPAFSSGSGRKRDKIDLLKEILHISFQPPTSLLQSSLCMYLLPATVLLM